MTRTWIGLGLWIALLLLGWRAAAALAPERRERAAEAVADVVRYWHEGAAAVTLEFADPVELTAGDGVYRRRGAAFRRVGEVTERSEDGRTLRAQIDPLELDTLPPEAAGLAFVSSGSFLWIYQSLLPPPTLARIRDEWRLFRDKHEERFLAELTPLLQDVARDVARILADELQASLQRHQDRVRELAREYGDEILRDAVLPLLVDEVWPIVQHHGRAPTQVIGRRLWERAPVFGFAWRGVYDSFPIGESSLVEERWLQYVREDAVPILREYLPLIQRTVSDILRDVAQNERVHQVMGDALAELASDPRVLGLVKDVLRDLVQSDRVQRYLRERGEDPQVTDLFNRIGDELDTVMKRIANHIVLDEDQYSIDPEFARFLRMLVLKRDRRWVLLEDHGGALATEPVAQARVVRDGDAR